MTELVGGAVGSVADYKVELVDGKMAVTLEHKDGLVEAAISLKLGAEPIVTLVFDKVKALIPGKIDDVILDEAKSLLLEKLAALAGA